MFETKYKQKKKREREKVNSKLSQQFRHISTRKRGMRPLDFTNTSTRIFFIIRDRTSRVFFAVFAVPAFQYRTQSRGNRVLITGKGGGKDGGMETKVRGETT